MKVYTLPPKGKIHRFEVHDAEHRYDVRDTHLGQGKYTWSCSCGRDDCRHIAAAKAKFFQKPKRPIESNESELICKTGFRPFLEA